MTNWEKFREELLKIGAANLGLAVVEGKPTGCIGTDCGTCLFEKATFGGHCAQLRFEWLDEECTEDNTCKTCIHFHLAEGLIRTGVCGLMEFEVARADETCGEYKRRQNK